MSSVERPGGVHIYYESHGPEQSVLPPLALAHGFGVSSDMWRFQQPMFTANRRLILWDARGHGASSMPESDEAYSMPLFAGDLAAVLDAAGVESAVIGGMSFGGMIALQFAVDFPERTTALVLSDSVPRGPEERDARAGPPGVSGAFAAMLHRPDLTPALPSLTMPVLVIYGEYDLSLRDGIVNLATMLPQRRVVCLDGCSHGTSAQRPWDWTNVVQEFLTEVEAGRPVGGEVTV